MTRFQNNTSTPAANDPHLQRRLTVRAGVQVDVWNNLPGEVNEGTCARLRIDAPPGIGSWGCEDTYAALESLAKDLEMLAREIRRLMPYDTTFRGAR